ncbi:MAG: glycosyltransferase [Thermodesulfobacteriota bacterium]
MRILFISGHFPDDIRTNVHGVYKRMGMFIDAIKDIASLDMLFYTRPETQYSSVHVSEIKRTLSEHWNTDIGLSLSPMAEYRNRTKSEKLINFGKGIFSIFNQQAYYELSGAEQVSALEECLNAKPDAIFAHRLRSMCPLLLTRKPLPPIFFDFDDIEHIVLLRHIKQLKRLRAKLLYLLIPALSSGERNAVRLAAETYVCSENDRAYVAKNFRKSSVVTIPNTVPIPALQTYVDEKTLLFLGSDYGPNLDAAKYLVKKIWPYVYREVPDAKLIIAGMPADKLDIDISKTPSVEITGFVDDLDGLYRRSRIIATPILAGGGTRIKIIEAAAYGKPVVSTSIGMEGIDLSPGREILICDNPKKFADECIRLLRNPDICKEIGSAAREKAILLYDRNTVLKLVRDRIASKMKISAP